LQPENRAEFFSPLVYPPSPSVGPARGRVRRVGSNDALEGGPTLALAGFVGFASAFLQTDLPRDPVALIVPAGCVLSDLL
jgi:hypothetical protein